MSSLIRASAFRTAAIVGVMFACAVLVSCSKGAKQTLRLNLVPGSTYVLSIRTSSDGVITTPDGNNIPFPTTSVNTFTLKAGDVDQQGNTLVTAEVGDTEFPMMFLPLATIVKGYSFGIKLSPVGHVSEFVDTETMRTGIRTTLAAWGSGATAYGNTSPESAMAAISDDALRAIIEPLTAVWPEVPVAPGDEWAGPDIYTPSSHTITSAKYRLESWDDAEAKVHVDLTIKTAGDRQRDPALTPAGVVNGKGSGEIRIDPVLGTIRSYEVTQQTNGTVQIGQGAESKLSVTSRVQGELTAR